MHVELRGIDDHVRELANGIHQRTFMRQTLAHRIVLPERVRTARLAVTAQQRIFAGLDENERHGMIFFQMFEQRQQFFQLHALARVHEQRGPSEIAFTGGVQLRKDRHQLHGQIIHAVKTHVLERMQDGAFSGAGKPGEDDEMP